MRALRVILLVLGILAVLAAVAAGIISAVLYSAHRDRDGYYASGPGQLDTSTRAVLSEKLLVGDVPSSFRDRLGRLRVDARSGGGRPLFVGVGPVDQVNRYLTGVPVQQVTDLKFDPLTLTSTNRAGTVVPAPPTAQTFWVAKGTGTSAVLIWKVTSGDWSVVVMNADASPGIRGQLRLAATLPLVRDIALWLAIGGGILFVIGIVLIVVSRRIGRPPAAPGAPAATVAPPPPPTA